MTKQNLSELESYKKLTTTQNIIINNLRDEIERYKAIKHDYTQLREACTKRDLIRETLIDRIDCIIADIISYHTNNRVDFADLLFKKRDEILDVI